MKRLGKEIAQSKDHGSETKRDKSGEEGDVALLCSKNERTKKPGKREMLLLTYYLAMAKIARYVPQAIPISQKFLLQRLSTI